MKNKLLVMILAVFTTLFINVNSANALESINEVDINGLTEPIIGQNVNFSYTLPENSNYIVDAPAGIECGWIKSTVIPNDETIPGIEGFRFAWPDDPSSEFTTFEKGYYYTFFINVIEKDSTTASFNNTTTAKINNKDANFKYTPDNFSIIYKTYTLTDTYNVTINPSTNGEVTGTSLTNVTSGENRVLTITPDANYMIYKVLVNNVDKTNEIINNQLTLNIDENKNVVATFKKIPVKLEINDVMGTTITPNGIINLESGDNKDITITPNFGYKLKSVKVNDVENLAALTGDKLLLTNITQDTEVVVVVEKIVYGILEGKDLTSSDLSKLTFRFDADYSKFVTDGKVFVDDIELTSSQFTSLEGSTIITLSEEFAKSLSTGSHLLKVVFTDGGVSETNFTIKNQITPIVNPGETPIVPVTPVLENPHTSDNIVLYFAIGLISLIGLTGATIYTKKRFN